jgi:DNA-directed RNA polymerase specialized sigma24 family protein
MAELSISEISGFLSIPKGTVKSRLYEARKRIRKEMKQNGYDRG